MYINRQPGHERPRNKVQKPSHNPRNNETISGQVIQLAKEHDYYTDTPKYCSRLQLVVLAYKL